MGNFRPVQPGATALLVGAGALVLLGVAGLVLRRGRAALPSHALLHALPDALGDAAVLLDGDGLVVEASAEAARLTGRAPGRLAGLPGAALLGEDLAVLRRGLSRGPASGAVTLATVAGPRRARAVIVRVGARPVRDLLVLRVEPLAARPPPLPAPTPPPAPARRAEARADLGAVAAALRDPAARARTAASMLRLLAPAASAAVDAELTGLDAALGDLERRLAALAAAGAARTGHPRAVELGALVAELLDGLAARDDLHVRRALEPARALADEARLRAALREVLRAAAAGLPAGGELAVAVAARGGSVRIAIESSAASGAAAAAEAAAVARALLGPEGGQVELEVVPGRGSRCTVEIPGVRGSVIEPA